MLTSKPKSEMAHYTRKIHSRLKKIPILYHAVPIGPYSTVQVLLVGSKWGSKRRVAKSSQGAE